MTSSGVPVTISPEALAAAHAAYLGERNPHARLVVALQAAAPHLSAAVREGERERLAAVEALHQPASKVHGVTFCLNDGKVWPCATARALAPPSLAAPEGTEQPC